MDRLEVAVKCLELAMAQAKNEQRHCEPERVVELQEKFYTLVTGQFLPDDKTIPAALPALRKPRPRKAAKPDIFK